jgi:4-amino-4-deoxy-L-arabinose transferase-like glycosyltransferase
MADKQKNTFFSSSVLLLLVLLLGSLILNLWGTGYGLPDKLYPDEGRIINHALAFGMGDFNPHYFNYPALSMYLLFLLYGAYYLVGHIAGTFQTVADFQKMFFTDPSGFLLIGRIWVAITGTAVVTMLYLLGKKIFKDRRIGLLSAIFVAPLPYFVFYCHFVVTDILLLFFLLLSYFFIIRISQKGKMIDYLMAGAAAGLGIATKYSPVFLAAPILLAHVIFTVNHKKRLISLSFITPLLLAFGAMILFFFIGSPYCFLDFGNFYDSLQFRELYGKEHTFGTGTGSAWLAYPRLLFFHGFLILNRIDLMGIIFIGGLIWAFFRRTKEDFLLLCYPLILYLTMGRWTSGSSRYALPLVVFLAIWGARAVVNISDRCRGSKLKLGWLRTLVYGFVFLAVGLNLLNTILMNYKLCRKDTRTLAREWIEERVPPGTPIALEWDTEATVQLWETPDDIQEKINSYKIGETGTIHHSPEQMATVHQMRLHAVPEKNYRIIRMGGMDKTRVKPANYSIQELRENGAEILVTSGQVTWIFDTARAKEIYPEQVKFYRQVDKDLLLIKKFQPNPLNVPGPVIKIYKLN